MSDFVLIVTAAYDPQGNLHHATNVIKNGASMPYPSNGLPVLVGDRISWFVQMQIGNQRRPIPYHVNFDSTAFFGVSSLAVNEGGASAALPVKTLQGKTKFSVTVPGIGVILDPEIQTGTNGLVKHDAIADYTIIWNIDNNLLQYQAGAGQPKYFPMPAVVRCQTIEFKAISKTIPPTIVIEFPDILNNWASPFSPTQGEFPAAGAPATPAVGPLSVTDNLDPSGTAFTFYARTADSTKQSGNQNITLA